MNRRGFLSAMLTACAAPAIVRADSLMRIVPVNTLIAPVSGMQIMAKYAPDICAIDRARWFTRAAAFMYMDEAGIVRISHCDR